MIRHIWSVVCRDTVVNKENNALSIMNIFEGLNIELKKDTIKNSQINIPLQYEIATLLRKDNVTKEEKVELKAEILDPHSQEIVKQLIVQLVIPKDKFNYRHIIKASGFKISNEGEYNIVIQLRQSIKEQFKTVSSIPIDVHFI